MSTKREIIASALGEIGLAGYIFDATPEQLEDARSRLDRLFAGWDGVGIRVGYNFGTNIDAESGIPNTAEECAYTHLALRIAPSYGKMVSPDTKVAAKNGFNALYAARRPMPQAPRSPALPLGAGNRRGVLNEQYFPDTTEVEGLNDGATEY